uniref:Co-chaperonin GroES n=1 Tax=uncultured virus TaxID=340016 RepID=A0A221S3G7_9VIRU|nr:co-chaperonin GroES [uncultured virus]
MSTIIPLDDRILVKRDGSPDKTSSGLYIPDGSQEPSQKGTVIAVGAGKQNDNGTVSPMRLTVGDRILFNKAGAISIGKDNEDFVLMSERTVYAILGHIDLETTAPNEV